MQTERLFKVLVLGGAALGLGCSGPSDAEPEAERRAAGGRAGSGSGGTQGETAGGGGTGGGAESPDAGRGGSVLEAGGGGGMVVAGAGGASGNAGDGGGAGPLECSVPDADPADACGCPCCWLPGCLNNEDCCSGFCRFGDDGNGCCP